MTPVSSRRRVLGTVGAAVTVGLAGCTGGGTDDDDPDRPDPAVTVRMTEEFKFDPETVEIEVGDTVEWKNDAAPRQSVTAYEDEIPAQTEYFASSGSGREIVARVLYPFVGGLNQNDRYYNTFEMAGTYRYFSIPSEGDSMTGTVVVSE